MLDSIARVETPEGVELDLSLAGPISRGLAWALDAVVRVAVYLVLFGLLSPLGTAGWGLWLVGAFAVEWLYPVAFEVWGSGATPGKRALGLRVLHADGTPVGLSASMVRNLLRFVDFLPGLYGFGFVCMVLDRRFRRLGDLAAGTVVVYVDRPAARAARPGVVAKAPTVVLTRAEQRAIMEFAERAPRLAPARARELAALAAPVAGRSDDAVSRLYAIANHLAGSA